MGNYKGELKMQKSNMLKVVFILAVLGGGLELKAVKNCLKEVQQYNNELTVTGLLTLAGASATATFPFTGPFGPVLGGVLFVGSGAYTSYWVTDKCLRKLYARDLERQNVVTKEEEEDV